jgi:hypothetical protein
MIYKGVVYPYIHDIIHVPVASYCSLYRVVYFFNDHQVYAEGPIHGYVNQGESENGGSDQSDLNSKDLTSNLVSCDW